MSIPGNRGRRIEPHIPIAELAKTVEGREDLVSWFFTNLPALRAEVPHCFDSEGRPMLDAFSWVQDICQWTVDPVPGRKPYWGDDAKNRYQGRDSPAAGEVYWAIKEVAKAKGYPEKGHLRQMIDKARQTTISKAQDSLQRQQATARRLVAETDSTAQDVRQRNAVNAQRVREFLDAGDLRGLSRFCDEVAKK